MQPGWSSRKRGPEDSWQPDIPSRGRSPAGNSHSRYASSETDRVQRKRGRGKGATYIGDVSYVPTTEHRIPVDIYAFPPDANIIMQLLGPRGKHQQRMKSESDSIVTTSGKGSRGPLLPGEEPLSLVIRSKDPSIPLTPRQVATVHQIYEDIIRHVKEYDLDRLLCVIEISLAKRKPFNKSKPCELRLSGGGGILNIDSFHLSLLLYALFRFGNSDSAASGPLNYQHIAPSSLIEFLWDLHTLLSRPRAQDLRVDDLFGAYLEMFNRDCPIASWLVVDPASGGVLGALKRISHVVELYHTTQSGPWLMRAANPPDFSLAQLREVDDAYKIRLQQIAAGQIPLEDLADSSGITGMLFGLDKVTACVNIVQGILRILVDKTRNSTVGMDLGTLQHEFQDLFKVPLDVYHFLSERSLLQFLVKFKVIFNLYNDGVGWKIMLAEGWDIASSNMENLVRVTILVQPRQRRVVRLSGMIPLPVAPKPEDEEQPAGGPSAQASTDSSIAALVSMLQGFQKPAAPQQETSAVTAQIQQLIQKKKTADQAPPAAAPAAAPSSGTALNELMAALQAAKQK